MDPPEVVPTLSCARSAHIIPLTFQLIDIMNLLKYLNTNKVAGLDGVSIWILIDTADETAHNIKTNIYTC